MTTLRNAFVQSCHSGFTFCSLLSTIPCLLAGLLFCTKGRKKDEENHIKEGKITFSFERINKLFKIGQEKSTLTNEWQSNSLSSLE